MLFWTVFKKNSNLNYSGSFGFALQLFANVFQILVFYGISKFVTVSSGQDYASFALPGLGAMELAVAFLFSSRQYLESEGASHTILFAATSAPGLLTVMFLESLWLAVPGFIDLAVYLAALFVLPGVHAGVGLNFHQISAAFVCFLVMIFQYWFLGLFSAGIYLLTRRGNSLNQIAILSLALVSGVYFPASRLPGIVTLVSRASALTAFSDALRGAAGADFLTPLLATAVLAAGSLLFFRKFYSAARREGRLAV